MATSAPPTAQSSGRHQRSIRNYLLDPAFQLKYTSYLVAITVALSLALGALLWRTSAEVMEQSHAATTQGIETVRRGQELVKESQKVSAVVRMNISKEYSDQPDLAKIFNEQAAEEAKRLEGEQKRLEAEALRLGEHAGYLQRQQQRIMLILVAALGALVVFIGCAGIVITHKIAGPIFKMKRQIRELGEGHMRLPGKLRKGDELVEFFETFEDTVKSLRTRQSREIAKLDRAIEELGGSESTALTTLKSLRQEMQAELD